MKFVDLGLVEVLDLLEFVIEDGGDEFVLSRNDGDNIVSVLVLFVDSDLFPLLDIEEASDLGEEDTEGDDNNTPGIVDDVPDVGAGFLDSNKLRTEVESDALVNSFRGEEIPVECPVVLSRVSILVI